MEREATRILDKLGPGPFVFNLGHGVVPQTPPEHVARAGRDRAQLEAVQLMRGTA